jgi:signal transduction histidine kinase
VRRLRFTLLLLALGIALPAALIVDRALSSLALENAIRHEAVAERVFDEMERTLSDFLLVEESRPPTDYAPDPSSPQDRIAPGAFTSSSEPFVVGWFTLDARGRVRTRVAGAGGAVRIRTAVREAFVSSGAEPSEALAEGVEALPAPGRTRSIGEAGVDRGRLAELRKDKAEQVESSAYEVFQSLNRAQRLRTERQAKALDEALEDQDSRGESPAPTPADFSKRGRAGAFAELRADLESATPPQLRESRDMGGLRALRTPTFPMPETPESVPLAPQASPGRDQVQEPAEDERLVVEPAPATADSEDGTGPRSRLEGALPGLATGTSVDPLIGRATGRGDLVLARSVWRGVRVERQGLVLERASLAAWLERTVVEESGLSDRVRLDFGPAARTAEVETPYRYLHRFAEPFDSLVARAALEPLPGLDGARPIWALAVLLGLVAVVGLFAVERMTRVVVDYARRRSDFVAAVSHELKTPLTSIRMYGEMLRDGLVPSDAKRSEYYGTITDESERLSRLIDNVLEFSRLEQDRRPLALVVGGLPQAIRETAEKLRSHVEREGFALRLELDEDLPTIRYDRDALTQLVFNLVDNALKYARGAATREIVIALRRTESGLELRVRDFGPGVPDEDLQRIFEPFFRVGEELTRSTKGSGIGLALVRELAERMGAAVRGRNAAGGGFEIAIAFPASA